MRSPLPLAAVRGRPHAIPPITDPMGRFWDQPDRGEILVDDRHAVMTRATFDALADYSSSVPTGVYAGKMWRRRRWIGKDEWLLCWFAPSPSEIPGRFSINHRSILLVDAVAAPSPAAEGKGVTC